MEAIRFSLIALFLLVPIGWWSRRHWRALQVLSRMADAFGRGDLSTRASVQRSASIAPLASRINEMADRIAALLEARKHMLHSVSHELRTPIARLEFGLELLRDRHAGDDAGLQRRLHAMATDIDELKALVNELLSLNQLDHVATMPRLAFAVAPLLRGCVPPPGPQRFSASIGDALGELHGDPRLLARAINNLLGNAARYARSRIVLSATRGDRLHIVIEDDGPGIPPEARERVFEPLYRLARDADHAAPGYGLGLAIAARAIALHGGTLEVDDSALGGARFTASLPACPQPAGAVAPPH
jgi:two-component system OmpR family sensor kinase